MSDAQPQFEVVQRNEEDEDHDLLTYNESAARMTEEMALIRGAIESGKGDAETLHARLALLESAYERNVTRSKTDVNGSGFLAYEGPGSTL